MAEKGKFVAIDAVNGMTYIGMMEEKDSGVPISGLARLLKKFGRRNRDEEKSESRGIVLRNFMIVPTSTLFTEDIVSHAGMAYRESAIFLYRKLYQLSREKGLVTFLNGVAIHELE